MFRRLLSLLCFLAVSLGVAKAQAKHTAERRADLQIGLDFGITKSDYTVDKLKGGGLYATLDFTPHFGGEFDLRQANSSTGDSLYERTYEVGGRYFRNYGKASPYVKAMVGRGVFNFPQNIANLAYNMFAGGVGLDLKILPYLNARADYEYQRWVSFPPTGLKPQVFSVGVAYHFPSGLRRGKHY